MSTKGESTRLKPKNAPLIEEISDDEEEVTIEEEKPKISKRQEKRERKASRMMDPAATEDNDSEELKALKREVLKKAFSTFKETEEKKQTNKSAIAYNFIVFVFIVSVLSLFIFQAFIMKIAPTDVITPKETQELFSGNSSIKAFNILLGMAYSPRLTLLYLAVTDRQVIVDLFDKSGLVFGKDKNSYLDLSLKVMGCAISPRLFFILQSANVLIDRHYDLVESGTVFSVISEQLQDFGGLYSLVTDSFWKNDKTFETLFFSFSIFCQVVFLIFDFASRIGFFKRGVKFLIMLLLWVVLNSYFIPPMILSYMFKITYFIQPGLTLIMYLTESLEIKYEKQLLDSQEREQREAFLKDARETLKKAQQSKKQE
ncbi:predicted protein [Naegleria gruberi]|uniref:Predicted protein n=1 Tax=Naegleria gruberi TaxID=5762 RepID=D2VDS7_NAEGR|nr:uncharacterized protein NAEGRDRAFT_48727 [Naegleria gruberi]EFC44951.1 predicted protein [Naegleria gruberi]|eukprot:XP_002677695.1 predicted protein [Naegleria gruberi strain NEG-M]